LLIGVGAVCAVIAVFSAGRRRGHLERSAQAATGPPPVNSAEQGAGYSRGGSAVPGAGQPPADLTMPAADQGDPPSAPRSR
jgi:hypothetical protein